VKRTEKGKSSGAVIQICMGTTQGNSLCSHLYLKLPKGHISHFIFYVFSPTKLENRRTEQVLPRCGRGSGWHWWKGEGGRERGRRVNMVIYTLV
jgi:hypothetical protein